MNLDGLLASLQGVRRSASGYVALCPAHNNRYHRSLSIRQANKCILMHCFRECSIQAICEALHIRVRDLFECGSSNDSKRA